MSEVPADRREIADTLEALKRELEALVVRGVGAAVGSELARLEATRDELAGLGASHLAERLTRLVDAARGRSPDAAGALLRTWTSLRVFERVLTLDTVAPLLDADGTASDAGDRP